MDHIIRIRPVACIEPHFVYPQQSHKVFFDALVVITFCSLTMKLSIYGGLDVTAFDQRSTIITAIANVGVLSLNGRITDTTPMILPTWHNGNQTVT